MQRDHSYCELNLSRKKHVQIYLLQKKQKEEIRRKKKERKVKEEGRKGEEGRGKVECQKSD